MDQADRHPDPQALRRLHPFDRLSGEQLELLARSTKIQHAPRGKTLIQLGDTTASSLYLLKGRLHLHAADGRVTEVSEHSLQALSPVAHLIPRRYQVTSLTPVEYLMLDARLLEAVLSDQTEGIWSAEISMDEAHNGRQEIEDRLTEALLADLNNDRLKLPSLPDIAVRVGREMNEENSDAHRLASIIQTDPAITTKLIRAANSPVYAGVTPVDSCTAAIVRLGSDTTHKLVLSFALRELFITHSNVLKSHMRQLWEHSVKVSAVCFILARLTDRFDPEHALLAGLLHDIGVVAILSYAEGFPEMANDADKLDGVIADLRAIVGSRILRTWGFTEDLVTAAAEAENWLRDDDQPPDYADLVIVAQLHSFIGTSGMQQRPTLDQVPALKKLQIGELTPMMSLNILDKAEEQIARAESLLHP